MFVMSIDDIMVGELLILLNGSKTRSDRVPKGRAKGEMFIEDPDWVKVVGYCVNGAVRDWK
jgi:hypothetical protein